MKMERDERGPRQEDPASRLRSEPLNKAPSSRLRSDPKGKALSPVPDRAKAGPSWKKAAAKAGEPERAAQVRDPERAVPLADTTEEQTPAQSQGAAPVVEAPAGAPRWRARAAATAGVASGQVVPKPAQAEDSAPAQPSDKLHEAGSPLRQDPEAKLHLDGDMAPGPGSGPEAAPVPPENGGAEQRKTGVASGQVVPKPAQAEDSAPAQPADKLHEAESPLRQDPEAKLHRDGDVAPGPEAAPVPQAGKRKAGDTIRRWQKGHGPTQEGEGHRPKPKGSNPGPAGAAPVSGEAASPELSRATDRVEKRSGKLEKAQGRLARQKPPKRPGPVKRAAGFAGRTLHGYVHGKVYEAEQENVGLEGAHRVELAGETLARHGVRTVKRRVRQHPAKAVQRAERRYAKAKAEQVFQQARLKHPDLTREKGALARLWRKRRLKKQYQKQAQQAARKTAQETATVTEKLGRAIAGFIKRHPVGCVLVVLVVLLLLVMQSCMSSVTAVGNGVVGSVGGSTYPAEDTDLTGAETAYAALEAQLQDYLDRYEATHSYDEYHFDLDEIEHDPYVLLAILSALHDGEWTLADVQGELQTIFDRQYILTETVARETRYRIERGTDAEGNPTRTRVPYSYYICTVTLENANLSHLPVYMMSTNQLSRYALYMACLGNRPDLFPTSEYVDKYITNPPAPHEIPEAYLADPTFAAMLAEAEKYLGYPYVWGGSSPATSFDCSGFVSWVANQCGWDIGRLGATGLYNICTTVSTPKPGDIVFFTGTFDAEGVTHCGIYVGDGWMLHCGDPIQYANLNTSYWQSHFYAYGRLP